MPRAGKPDVLDEIRAFRAKRDAYVEELRRQRVAAVARVAEIDELLAEFAVGGARAAETPAPDPPAPLPKAKAKTSPSAPRLSTTHGRIARVEAAIADLRELQPWFAVLGGNQRKAAEMRLAGKTTSEIAQHLGQRTTAATVVMLCNAKAKLRAARERGAPLAETPASDDDDEGEPAPECSPEEVPSDPADAPPVEPLPLPAGVLQVLHLWSPASGGTPTCGLPYHPELRYSTQADQVTCSDCDAIFQDDQAAATKPERPPEWVMRWMTPEVLRAYQGVALEGLSPQTMAWTENVTPNVISGRVNGARTQVKRLLAWEAQREAEGIPLTDKDRTPPERYAEAASAADPLLALFQTPAEATPMLARSRMHLKVIDGRVRGKTIAGRLSRVEKREGADLEYPDVDRPRTRGDCASMPRPCPFVSCSHHLYLDVNPESGTLKLNFPHLEVDELPETCSLDVADRGGITLEEVGAILNLTRERIRQVETRGLDKMAAHRDDLDVMPAAPVGYAV